MRRHLRRHLGAERNLFVFGAALRTTRQMRRDALPLLRAEFIVVIRRKLVVNVPTKHSYQAHTYCRKCASRTASALCPRFSREATVPGEQSSTRAISS